MKVIQNDKTYKKADKSTQRSIRRAVEKLQFRLSGYFEKGMRIETIFNDDILIHDIINKHYYVYKCCIDKIQLRILYTIRQGNLVIISHYCKKSPTKEYISYFEKVSSDFERSQYDR